MSDKEKKKKYKLFDVDVDTVGLVPSGANREVFFLLKSESHKEDNMKDVQEREVEQTEESVSEPSSEINESAVAKVLEKLFGLMKANQEVDEPEEEEAQEDVQKQYDAEIEKLRDAQAELEAKLEKAEAEAQEERSVREKQEFVEKAKTFDALPVEADELAEHLLFIHKADAEKAEWVEELLSAVNKQLHDAGLFSERGTSELPEQADGLFAKAQEMVKLGDAETIKDAMLAISPDEAKQYLSDKRRAIKQGKK